MKGELTSDMAWKKILKLDELKEKELKKVIVNDKEILLVKIGENIYAIDNICSHEGAPLNEGFLEDDIVVCPWHGARFSLKDGKVQDTPWATDLKNFETKVEEGYVWIKLD